MGQNKVDAHAVVEDWESHSGSDWETEPSIMRTCASGSMALSGDPKSKRTREVERDFLGSKKIQRRSPMWVSWHKASKPE